MSVAQGVHVLSTTFPNIDRDVAVAGALLHDIGKIDAYARDPALFEWRTRTQIEEGRSWLWEEEGTILFKAEASAWTDRTVQLQQVWVDPSVRGNGYGKRGLADLCRLLLARTPSVCLFVRLENAPAIALYFKSIGHEDWFYYYLSGMIFLSLLVYSTMRDTKRDSAMHRHV